MNPDWSCLSGCLSCIYIGGNASTCNALLSSGYLFLSRTLNMLQPQPRKLAKPILLLSICVLNVLINLTVVRYWLWYLREAVNCSWRFGRSCMLYWMLSNIAECLVNLWRFFIWKALYLVAVAPPFNVDCLRWIYRFLQGCPTLDLACGVRVCGWRDFSAFGRIDGEAACWKVADLSRQMKLRVNISMISLIFTEIREEWKPATVSASLRIFLLSRGYPKIRSKTKKNWGY